jgi:AcrR family transcriptional regulator
MPVLGKTKKHVVSEFRSTEILEAAKGVFARKGFAGATVDDIAEAAGLAKGTVYLYFPSKRDIYVATVRMGIVSLQDEVRRSMEHELDTAGKIREFVRTRLGYCDRHREFMRIYYTEFSNLLHHEAHVRREFQDLYDRQADALAKVLETGIARKEIRPLNPLGAARIIYDMTRGVIAQRLLGWSQSSVDEDAEFLFDFVWRGVACQEG